MDQWLIPKQKAPKAGSGAYDDDNDMMDMEINLPSSSKGKSVRSIDDIVASNMKRLRPQASSIVSGERETMATSENPSTSTSSSSSKQQSGDKSIWI